MSKFLDELLLRQMDEMYDGNSYAIGNGEGDTYIQKLMKARSIGDYSDFDEDDDDTDVYPDQLYSELRYFSQHNEDDITIHYPHGEYIQLDKAVVKQILANISPEDIQIASENLEYFHALIHKMYDEVVTLDRTQEDMA